MYERRTEIRWARRLRPDKIRRLYTLDAQGIADEELIDDVGYAMYARCESIRTATEAHTGRVACPRCKAAIVRAGSSKEEEMLCACGWRATSGEYFATYQRKQLVAGSAYPAFLAFIDVWPQSRSPQAKLRAIDHLIHACHGGARFGATRSAACNLIEGRNRNLIAMLDELAYGRGSTPGVTAERDRWRAEIGAWRARRSGKA